VKLKYKKYLSVELLQPSKLERMMSSILNAARAVLLTAVLLVVINNSLIGQKIKHKSVLLTRDGENLNIRYTISSKAKASYQVIPTYTIDKQLDTMIFISGHINYATKPNSKLTFNWEVEKELKFYKGIFDLGFIVNPFIKTHNIKRGDFIDFDLNLPDTFKISSVKLVNIKGKATNYEKIKKYHSIQITDSVEVRLFTGSAYPKGKYQILIKGEGESAEVLSPIFKINPKISNFYKIVLPGLGLAYLTYFLINQANQPAPDLPGAPTIE
jgi:hypothetical protein